MVALTATCAESTTPGTIGAILCNVKDQALVGILIFIYAASLLIGSGLIVAGIFKLKQVKENPTQIPVSTPGAFFIAGAMLLFIPNVFPKVRQTVFGSSASGLTGANEYAGKTAGETQDITNLFSD
jgi:hypothetical protein